MKLLMYGAGNIGRGFIGCIFAQAGYEVVFVDINRQTVDAINSNKCYIVGVITDEPYDITVWGVRAVDGGDHEAVAAEIASCDIMATSLGASALEKVAPIIAEGFTRRCDSGKSVLDILICENLKDAAHKLRGWIEQALPQQALCAMSSLGMVEAAIGRMVPAAATSSDTDLLRVNVEEYDFLPVDKNAFCGQLPNIPQLVPYSPFTYYEDRKLYLHNMSHAICAYLGLFMGYEYIWQAVGDPVIRLITERAMTESASMLSITYNIPFLDLYRHAEDLLLRFANRALGDTCARVARDTPRKLAADDRFAAPIRNCAELGIHPVNICMGLASALSAISKEPSAARETLVHLCRLPEREIQIVMELHELLLSGKPAAGYIYAIDRIKRSLRGRIV